MKYLVFIILLLIGTSVQSSNKDKEAKANEIKELVESQQFRFIAQTAIPRAGSSINLTSYYDFQIDSMEVSSWLPFYGRAYQVEYGGDGGIKFEETARTLEIELNKKKKSYQVSIEVDTKKDNYKINMSVGLSGYASLDVISTYKQGISFYGIVEPIQDKE